MQSKPALLKILDVISILSLGVSTYFALVYAPKELVMGDVQRVFYFHLGTAWVGLLGFLFASILSIVFLITRNMRWDRYQVAAIEVSLVFFFITIVLGSIWARPAWNTWWTWDPRLTTAAITELVYIAYFMLRQGIDDPDRRARFGAVYALIGGISAPVTFFAIRLYRTIHPVVIAGSNSEAQGAFAMTPHMLTAMFVALGAFTIIFADLYWNRIRLGDLQDEVEQLKLKVTM